jgi:hypothetical protein
MRLDPLLDHARKQMIIGGATSSVVGELIVRWAVEDLLRQRQDPRKLASLLRSLADRLDPSCR